MLSHAARIARHHRNTQLGGGRAGGAVRFADGSTGTTSTTSSSSSSGGGGSRKTKEEEEEERRYFKFHRGKAAVVSAACQVAKAIVGGARALGLTEFEAMHRDALVTDPGGCSVLASTTAVSAVIRTRTRPWQFVRL